MFVQRDLHPIGGIYFGYCANGAVRDNAVSGFATPMLRTANATGLNAGAEAALAAQTVAPGGTVTVTAAVGGAAVGDFVLVSHSNPSNIQQLLVSGAVAGAGAVTVSLYNPGASAVTVGAGSLYVEIRKNLQL